MSMKTIYFDYTGDSLGSKNVKYHGGGDFSRFILWKLEEQATQKNGVKIRLLWPKGIIPENLSVEEQEIYSKFDGEEISSLNAVKYNDGDILFLPLLDAFSVKKIGIVKRSHPNLLLYGVLHGLRLLDVCKYDKYDRYYYKGLKANPFILWPRRWVAGLMSKVYLRRYLRLADRIYTVSNCSMQKINSIADTQYIKYFTRDITPYTKNEGMVKASEERYILFINANRYEKNFIRSLEAFCIYKKQYGGNLKLYVLGASKLLQDNIEKIKSISQDTLKEDVVFLGYVSPERLHLYFAECEFLLYTSKSEGYGLPPLEAMTAGRPTVAASTTSVPEVLGMCAHYVNPYSVQDIASGIEYMSHKENQEKYTRHFPIYLPFIQKRGSEDIKMLVNEILS